MISASARERLKKEVADILRKYSHADIHLLIESVDEALAEECGPKLDQEIFAILEELVLEERIELAKSKIIWRE